MKTVYILGAGVDCALGLPLADGLLRELAAFVNGEGRGISSTLKAKLGGGRRVRFSFDKYVANQGESFAERILTDSSIASAVESALAKANGSSSGGAAAVQTIIEKLGQIRAANELDEPTAAAVAELAGESAEMADPTMLRMRGVALNPSPRSAIVKIFRTVRESPDLSDPERQALGDMVAAMTNFEDLLTELFSGFYSRKNTEIRNYLYVSWILWSYMRWKSLSVDRNTSESPNFYGRITPFLDRESVITFNYTSFFDLPPDRTVRFHGDCLSYIRHDRGELIENDEAVTDAEDVDALEEFIGSLDMDVDRDRIFLPAIVPPSAMKPVINREFISRWAQAEEMMAEADLLVAVGYAFHRIDSHFNDLFRQAGSGKRLVVVNPDLDGARTAVCGLFGIDPSTLTSVRRAGVDVHQSGQLRLVPTRGEEVTEELVAWIRGGSK